MRVLGITIPENRQLKYGLTAIHGVGLSRAKRILADAKIDPLKKAPELTQEQENQIRKMIEGMILEGELKREIQQNIKRLKDIGAYRGDRHSRQLPVRGQRTKTNQRTRKGNKRNTMGSGKVKVSKT